MRMTPAEKSRAFRERNKAKGLTSAGKIPVGYRKERLSKRDYNLRSSYGITEAQYLEIYNKQNGKCAICGDFKDKLYVDHDHSTNKVRKLLCHHCNTGIGYLKNDFNILRKAANYVLDCSIEHQTQELLEKTF